MTDHLTVETSDRGFDYMAPIPSEYGGDVAVSESSAASGPHIWLRATAAVSLNRPDGPSHEVPIHLTAENAWRLAEQLRYLVEHHYQGDARPARNAIPGTCRCGALIEELDGEDGFTYWAHVKRMRIEYDHSAVPSTPKEEQ